ncbi:2-methylcitrate dehydratase PrpD [Rhizobiales bacterium GAS113]|nr:2-methylcitrate dehydratase PrpD [Rhizobiales bacterium GAS113]
MDGPSGSATHPLVEFARRLSFADVSPSARSATRLAILDSIGCMLGGSRTGLARQAAEFVLAMGGNAQATVSGRGLRTSMPLAAFLNSVHANALDYDDAFERDGKGMGHPGASVIPAALAAAEHAGATGQELLTAIVAGYETANRIIEAIQPTPARHARVWGVAVHQAFGAAIAAARLLRLGELAFHDAFGLAGTMSAVPAARKWNWTNRPLSSPKDVVASQAESGVKAACLAASGWHGSRDMLDGETGFWIMAGSDRCDPTRFTDRLGTRWTVEELSFKPYPACRWVHAALEAAEHLMREGALRAADIREIEVGSFEDVVENFAERRPKTMVDAEFSLPWTMAVTIAGLPKGPQWYSDATLNDPAIQAIADNVLMVVDREAQARHFSEERKSMSVVRLVTCDGRRLERRVAVALGGVSPWPKGGIEAKFHSLADPVIGEEAAGELRRGILGLDEGEPIGPLYALIGGPSTERPR